jgi:hypothetical protein
MTPASLRADKYDQKVMRFWIETKQSGQNVKSDLEKTVTQQEQEQAGLSFFDGFAVQWTGGWSLDLNR